MVGVGPDCTGTQDMHYTYTMYVTAATQVGRVTVASIQSNCSFEHSSRAVGVTIEKFTGIKFCGLSLYLYNKFSLMCRRVSYNSGPAHKIYMCQVEHESKLTTMEFVSVIRGYHVSFLCDKRLSTLSLSTWLLTTDYGKFADREVPAKKKRKINTQHTAQQNFYGYGNK